MGFLDIEQAALPVPDYTYITREEEARKALAEITKYPVIEVDTEGTSLDPYSCKTTLLQIGLPNNIYIFDLRHDLPDVDIHGSLFKDILTSKNTLKLLQNANYDLKVLKAQYGFYIENIYDTMIAEQLLHLGIKERGFSLANLVAKYLNMQMDKEPRKTFSDYYQEFTHKQLSYAATDVCILDIIRHGQLPNIDRYDLWEVLQLEMDFLKPMAEMELNGITLDVDKWRIIMGEAEKEMLELKADIERQLTAVQDQATLFGVSTINIASPAQLLDALNKIGISVKNTDVATLSKYKGHPVIDAILSYRKLYKLVTTYGEAVIERIHPVTGRLHTAFKQMVSTGRMSSNNPNLQNIPGKQKFRSCFIAKPGYVLITVDQNSAELAIMGDMSGEQNFIETHRNKLDLHRTNASRIFNIEYKSVTNEQRKASKALSFGLCLKADTKVLLSAGMKTIDQVNVGDVIGHDLGDSVVEAKQCTGEKECFEIITKYGYTLEATKEHLIKVIDVNGNYVDKKVEDLNIDEDYVCIKKGTNLFPRKLYKFSSFNVDKFTNYKHMQLPKYLTKDMAAFLGLFISEGSIQKVKGRPTYSMFNMSLSANSNGGLEFIFSAFALLKRVFGNRFTCFFITENRTQFALNSVLFCEWVMSLFNSIVIKNKDIHVPSCIKQSPKEVQAEFLKWLFEGDGIHKNIGNGCRVEYLSRSYNLVHDLQIMLLNFGILTSIRCESRAGYPGEKYYVLYTVGKECYALYMKQIGFVTRNKTTHCRYSSNIGNLSSYFLNNQKELLNKLYVTYSKSATKSYKIYDTIRNCLVNSGGVIGSLNIERLIPYDESGFLAFIKENDIVPLPIKSIKSVGTHKVYDLTIKDHPYFLANGFVVHNCYGISAVGLARRLKISDKEAQELINKYFEVNSTLKRWLEQSAKEAVKNGYSKTITGRCRFYNIPDYNDPQRKRVVSSVQRAAKNHRIQGCLVSGTYIKGVGYIEDQVGKTINLETGFGKDTATGVFSGKKEVYDLKLSNGVTLGITEDHKIPVVNNEGLVDKKVKELNEEDYLLIPLNKQEGQVTDISNYKDCSDVPAFIPKLIEKCLRRSPTFFDDFNGNERAQLRRFKTGRASFKSWRYYYNFLPKCKEKEFLSKFLEMDFCKIKSLTYRGIEPTYDLVCDNIHYFIANGVIVHNSDADTIKKAMILCVDRLEKSGIDAKLLLSVHDEIVIEAPADRAEEVAKIVTSSVDEGFNTYFNKMPMTTDAVIGPCWIKSECTNKVDGKECGHNVMTFTKDDHYGTMLICEKCGAPQY